MFYFTNDQIDEIEKRLAVRAKKDTDFDAVSEAQEGDLVAIIHNGRNMICRLDKLPGRLVAKRYDEIPAEITEENILETPTAFSISVLKTLLGIEDMPEFDDDTAYEKGSYVSYTDANGILRGYVFTADKPAGYWDESKVTEINYASLSENIKDILSEFKSGGRVYVLESYFSNGKAKKAIADEDGKNIKQYYALKTDIPDVNREIAEAIAVKLDNTPKGSHEVPIYIARDPQTGYGKSEVIDSLHLPGDIRSDLDIFAGRGVAAYGIATLGMGGSGGGGTLTEIQINGTTIPDIHGVVNLPAYPSALSQLTSDTTHRLVTDSQISYWTEKYDLPSGGIPKTDLSNSVQDTLDTADSSAVTLGNLIAGLTSKGAHNLPIYFDSNTDVQEIDSLLVPGDIQSTQGGVSAFGISSLALGGGGGQGTLTEIQIDGTTIPDVEGIVDLPAYPTWATLSGKPALSTVALTGSYNDLNDKPSIPQGTVTSVGMTVPTGLSVSPSAITDSGTFEITFASGYAIPTTAKQGQWDAAYTHSQITAGNPHGVQIVIDGNQIKTTNGTAITVPFATVASKVGTSNVGSASLPIYLNAGVPTVINSLEVAGNIQSTAGGVSAVGIAALSISGGGGGSIAAVKLEDAPDNYPEVDGIVSISKYINQFTTDSTHRLVTDTNIATWNTAVSLIPSQAYSSGNQLADKFFVNSSIATATATFRGTNTTATTEADFLTWANALTHDLNDYVFWKTEDAVGNVVYKRYKYDGSQWAFEYDLNNSSFTADQWAAINSGLSSTDKTKLDGIAAGAQVNVLEAVKLNGTALAITGKAVNITNIPLGALASAVQTSLGKADTALQSGNIFTLTIQKNGSNVDTYNPLTSPGKTINISDVASLSAFNTLKGALTSKGSHNRPIYLNSTPEGVEIDALNVPGDIESTAGGVSAFGIASLNVLAGGGSGTLTEIQINGISVPDTSGIVNITALSDTNGQIKIAGQAITINGWQTVSDYSFEGHTAYGWGNHANAGYLLASMAANTYLPLSGGTMSNTNLVTNLNADLLDGREATGFVKKEELPNSGQSYNANSLTNAGTYYTTTGDRRSVQAWENFPDNETSGPFDLVCLKGENSSYPVQFFHNYNKNDFWLRFKSYFNGGPNWKDWAKIWTSANHGSGSGLDADLLDGKHASEFFYNTPVSSPQDTTYGDSPVSWAESYAENNPNGHVYNSYGVEYSYLMGMNANKLYGTILKLGYADTYLRILRKNNGSWQTNDWEKISAGYADSAGSVAWSNVSSRPTKLSDFTDDLGSSPAHTHSQYVPIKPHVRFYNYIGSSHGGQWYKVTLPFHATTSTQNRWMMVSMEIVLKGNFSSGADGRIYLSYYIYYAANNNVGEADKVHGIAIGSNMNVRVAYKKSDLGIFYVYQPVYYYNAIAIQNLSACDSAPSYDFTTTTIEAISSSSADIPAEADIQDIAIRKIYTQNGSGVYIDGSTIWHAGNDGSGSGLDADLLDGYHATDINTKAHASTTGSFAYWKVRINYHNHEMLCFTVRVYQSYEYYDIVFSGYDYVGNNWYSPQAVLIGSTTADGMTVYFGHDDDGYLWVAVTGGSYTGIDVFNSTNGYIQTGLTDAALYTIAGVDSLSGTTDSTQALSRPWYRNETVNNATNATQLQTSRSIWGQSFNGTGDITGNLTLSTGDQINCTDPNNNGLAINYNNGRSGGVTTATRFYNGQFTEVMRIDSTGNVGIGTASPAHKLDILGGSGNQLRLIMASNYTANNGPSVVFAHQGGEEMAFIQSVFNQTNQGNYCNLHFGTRTSDALGAQTKMTILHNGNVGIGITSPSYKLHVVGDIYANGGVAAGGIVSMSMSGSGAAGNPVTQINVGSTSYTPTDGIVSLPAYPVVSWASLSGNAPAVSTFSNDMGYQKAITTTSSSLGSNNATLQVNITEDNETVQYCQITPQTTGKYYTIKFSAPSGGTIKYGYRRLIVVTNDGSAPATIQFLFRTYTYIPYDFMNGFTIGDGESVYITLIQTSSSAKDIVQVENQIRVND